MPGSPLDRSTWTIDIRSSRRSARSVKSSCVSFSPSRCVWTQRSPRKRSSETRARPKSGSSICFAVPEAAARRAREHLSQEFRDQIARKEIDGVDVKAGLATVAVVGIGMAGHLGIASRVFTALSDARINIETIATSDVQITCIVGREGHERAVRALHAAFGLGRSHT